MARKKSADQMVRDDLSVRALKSKLALVKIELNEQTGKRIAAEQEIARLRKQLADTVEAKSDFDFIADALTAAIQFVTEELDQTISDGGVPGRPETVLEDDHFGPRLARLADLGRRLREAHADVPAPQRSAGKTWFTFVDDIGQPWPGGEEAR